MILQSIFDDSIVNKVIYSKNPIYMEPNVLNVQSLAIKIKQFIHF